MWMCKWCQSINEGDEGICPRCGRSASAQPDPRQQQWPPRPVGGPEPEIRLDPVSSRNWLVTFLLANFLGQFGIDRFYTGDTTLGILKLITCGGCGIWSLIDILWMLFAKRRDVDGYPLAEGQSDRAIGWVVFVISCCCGGVSIVPRLLLQHGSHFVVPAH